MTTGQDGIRDQVRARYGAHARRVAAKDGAGDCCEPAASDCCDSAASSCCEPETLATARRLYTEGETEGLPTESLAASAGCGNPTALAGLRPGERVLDLGSGGGLDCFLAARQVGETGHVTGLDMTPEMLELARKNQAAHGFTNVEFVQGQMESMPLPGDSFDVIISNCVICLSPDKDAVFSESFRVLAPGGRIHLSDVLALTPDRASSGADAEDWVACAAGAEHREVYVDRLRRAGFEEIAVTGEGIEFRGESEKDAYPDTASFKVTARKPA